ncbi:Hypothetical predicted protein [Pelobates cultripes]|uniref:Uncharacterized protein n=1 Tax=Pelobates cultripes TaxID=61616 RepID=A0AAD1SPR4_PELCU|nr:Hypothetical predicted protein [Pelobates cultripes]
MHSTYCKDSEEHLMFCTTTCRNYSCLVINGGSVNHSNVRAFGLLDRQQNEKSFNSHRSAKTLSLRPLSLLHQRLLLLGMNYIIKSAFQSTFWQQVIDLSALAESQSIAKK